MSDLVITFRKFCVLDCGYDKSLTYTPTKESSMQDLETIVVEAESNFSHHEHDTQITSNIAMMVEAETDNG